MARLYRCTDAGRNAWDTQDEQVPLEYRRILGLVAVDTDCRELRAMLGWSEGALTEILEELEEEGLVTSLEADPDQTVLDFTDRLFVAELKAAHQELDSTGPLSMADLRAARKKTRSPSG